ncbi:MAG: FAD-binding and (Fe-S)-binding domain-containing protein [Nitrospirota bacterium]|nr:FAD-binding and (Fe-S)-binding domain-containing protein [Nitrospirota bacterium]
MDLVLPERKNPIGSDLRRLLRPDSVKDDAPSLRAYAVDASMYRMTPQAIVLPETEEDIDVVMDFALQRGIPLTTRAAGTNLTGSAVGSGIILDVSRLNRILEVNTEENWARIQPGIILAELNKQLSSTGLMFGPDPSSGDMCKLGGMLANNSSGPHTLRYGSVKDNVLSMRVRLESGNWLVAQPTNLDNGAFTQLSATFPELQSILELVQSNKERIQAKRPRVSKNSAGYNLFEIVDGLEQRVFDLPKLFVGSEGTLGVFSEATINLVPKPKAIVVAMIHFQQLEEVGEAVPHLLKLEPSALEIMDANTLDLIDRSKHGIPAHAAATLLMEFDHDQDPSRSQQLLELCRRFRLADDPVLAFDLERQAELWKARKALYPTLYRYDARKKPINYVDDVVVKAERMSDLIRYLNEVFGKEHVPVAIFGHIGNGNAHIVPLIDVNDEQDFQKMVDSYYEVHQTVLTRFEGSVCGEHGDGRVRAEMVRKMFGEELYGLFVQVKNALDPAGILNPGVKISDTSFTENIDFERLGKACATCAKCNSVCPVYDVFQSEDMSSRGWFEIVTAKDYSYLNSKRVVEACLNCKSCRTICPADVDVSELILQRRAEHPNAFAGKLFKLQAQQNRFGKLIKLAGKTQNLWDRPFVRKIMEVLLRPLVKQLSERAQFPWNLKLPRLATTLLRERHSELCVSAASSSPTGDGQRKNGASAKKKVAYFHGCAANYFDDGVGDAVIDVLKHYGVTPDLPPQRCSGTPIETYGHRELAKEGARVNLKNFQDYDVVVTGCASCTLALKDYATAFKGEPEESMANTMAPKVKHISELVMELDPDRKPGPKSAKTRKVTYHSSCHLRAAGVTKQPRQLLSRMPNVEFVEMQDADRCAGGAGTYIVKDYETSQKIVQRKNRAVMQSGADVVATSCPACMIQLRNGLGEDKEVKHIAQLIQESLQEE